MHYSGSSGTQPMIPHGRGGEGEVWTTARVSESFQLANCWQTHKLEVDNLKVDQGLTDHGCQEHFLVLSPGQFPSGKTAEWEGYKGSTMGRPDFKIQA